MKTTIDTQENIIFPTQTNNLDRKNLWNYLFLTCANKLLTQWPTPHNIWVSSSSNLWVSFFGPTWVQLSHYGDPISITNCCLSTTTTNFRPAFFKSLRFIKVFVGISYKGGRFKGLIDTSFEEVTNDSKGGSSSWVILYSIGLGEKLAPNWIFNILAHGSISLTGPLNN